MRPKTLARFDAKSFADLKRTAQIRSLSRRAVAEDPTWASPLPMEVSLQLTYQCNLRCDHCYQWNDQGFFREYDRERQKTELPVELIDDVLAATEGTRAKVFLWGGEPLLHSRFDAIAERLARAGRTVNMCTNGLLLTQRTEALTQVGAKLNLLISLDGRGAQHDALRGKGTFARTLSNLEAFLELQRAGRFQGELSLSCMVSNDTVGTLFEFAEWAEGLGVNSVYFQLPWFISPSTADAMDALYAEQFAWLNPIPAAGKATWRSYTYQLREELIETLREDMRRIAARTWKLRLRYQPELRIDEVERFIRGTSDPAQGKSRCLAVSNRLEVHADGAVSACKFFPEFVVGNLHQQRTLELWQSERFKAVRVRLAETGLMPVCSKCILLYLNGD